MLVGGPMPDAPSPPRVPPPRPGSTSTTTEEGRQGDARSSSRLIMSKPESVASESPPTEGSSRASPSDAPPLSHSDGADETASLLKQLTVGVIIDGKYRIAEGIRRG